MKNFYTILIYLTLIISCKQQNHTQDLSYPFKANVLALKEFKTSQNPTESPIYSFDDHQFQFLTDIQNLDGSYFKLYRGSSISQKDNTIKIQYNRNPKLNFNVINNIIVPKDYSSMAMLSAYYQFDVIATKLKTITDLDILDFFNTYGKIEIFFEPKFTQEIGSAIREEFPKENAAYIPKFHKFILFSRANSEHVPLSMNLQVIAHEFGHMIWEFLFDNDQTSLCDILNEEYPIMGLNEGFSDFISYTFTGSTNILQNSLNIESFSKMRNFSITDFNYEQITNIINDDNSVCTQSYYCIGTLFANALFKTQKILQYDHITFTDEQSRSQFLKKIIPALKRTKENMSRLLKIDNSSDKCFIKYSTNTTYDGMILGAFFYSFLNEIKDQDIQSTLNCSLIENFGTKGFPPEFRTGLCQ